MKTFFTGIILSLSVLTLPAQTPANYLSFVGKLFFPGVYHANGDTTGTSDVWGYTAPDGTEYAIIGLKNSIAFVRVPDLTVVAEVPAPANNDYYYHRDMKTYRNYCYAVAEMRGVNEGLMIMDLQYLPDSVSLVKTFINGSDIRSHNLSIDTAKGYAYILKQNYSGFRIVDINDPENPVEAGYTNTGEIHDVYARNDTAWVAEGNRKSYSMWDCTDKTNPQLIARWFPPAGGYAHNIWPTDDGKYALTTEETFFKTIKMWKLDDPQNIELKGQFLGSNNIAHNVHVKENYCYVSHYVYGITVLDISNPDSLVEVGYYDTYLGNQSNPFYGNWGVFPFSDNGYVYGSDIEGWLTVLKFEVPAVSVNEDELAPGDFSLSQNYPNPFNPATKIKFAVSGASGQPLQVTLKVFDVLGNEIAVLVNEEKAPGVYEALFNAGKLSSGIYFYKLSTPQGSITKKMILQK